MIVYIIGVLLGFIIYLSLDFENRTNIVGSLKEVVDMTELENFEQVNIIKNGIKINILVIALLVFSSFTILTFQVVAAAIMLRGISLSIYICILFNIFGPLKGIVAMFGMAIIPNLILSAAYMFFRK